MNRKAKMKIFFLKTIPMNTKPRLGNVTIVSTYGKTMPAMIPRTTNLHSPTNRSQTVETTDITKRVELIAGNSASKIDANIPPEILFISTKKTKKPPIRFCPQLDID